jgi:DNA helicase-2/ATP-dependent DNA helicase PcrA
VDLRLFSPSQRQVVEAVEGPLSVLAGPGSGKTTVLAGRIGHLVETRGVPPSTILAITFTTAAAATLRERLAGVLGADARDLTITTFHALGLRIVKQWSQELGFGSAIPAVYGRDDARTVLRDVATEFGLAIAPESDGRKSDPWSLSLSKLVYALDRFRLGVGGGHRTSDFDFEELDAELLGSLASAYEAHLRRRGAVDYPFMLTLPLSLFEAEARALRMVQNAYRFVIVDEFQDTCMTQFKLLRHVVDRHHNLAVVGDPAQACFEWRGAQPALLLEFPRQYPDAQVFALNQNYRSTGVVVALSNVLAAPLDTGRESWTSNANGPHARVYVARDELDEARFVAAQISELLASGQIDHPGEVAVLFRTNAQAHSLALTLRAAGVQFRVRRGADLFAQAEVRDVVAYLRLAHCPTDAPALARVLNVPPRKLQSIEQALRKRPVPVSELPMWAQKRGGPSARRAVEELLAMLNDLHQTAHELPPLEALEMVLRRTGYASWLATQEDAPTKLNRLEELRAVIEGSSAPDLATWLVDMHIGDVDAPAPVGGQAVTLSTIHAAKGAEWPVVFVVGFEDGLLPHLRAPAGSQSSEAEDAERRLAYVAVSRTQVLLYLVFSETRRVGSDPRTARLEPRRPSRFLAGLPPDLLQRVGHSRVA